MFWYIFGGLTFLILVLIAGYLYYQDRKYLHSKVSEVMGEDLKKEIEDEREEALKRKSSWEDALKSAR
ncbi:MAG: hypothetical protein ABIE74_00630, partial [Pseudomonadota bacterium]